MHAYPEVYLDDIVENQGKLFDYFAINFPDKDTNDFISAYMRSTTRGHIDNLMAYVATMDYHGLLQFFIENDGYQAKAGESMKGFMPDWIGEFYAYYQWYYNLPSSEIIDKVPLDFLMKAYWGLHDLDLDLAVRKVGS